MKRPNLNIILSVGRMRHWLLLGFGLAVCAVVMWYASTMAEQLKQEETKSIGLWADATRLLAQEEIAESEYVDVLLRIVQDNTTIPVVVCDAQDSILLHRNLGDDGRLLSAQELTEFLAELKNSGHRIEIKLDANTTQYLYYSNSLIIRMLGFLPFFQIGLAALFVVFAYVVFSRARRWEQDRVWEGLARETAHQLGTPISALMGWSQLLESGDAQPQMVSQQMNHDIARLQNIADRFQKIGSLTTMACSSIRDEMEATAEYLRTRAGKRISIVVECADGYSQQPVHNSVLMSWAVENLCRNSIDAMPKEGGRIVIRLLPYGQKTVIEITDNGRGMTKTEARRIFDAGFTTKKRGWGIGLTLTRRIVEQYHRGKISVLRTAIGQGTTMRIEW